MTSVKKRSFGAVTSVGGDEHHPIDNLLVAHKDKHHARINRSPAPKNPATHLQHAVHVARVAEIAQADRSALPAKGYLCSSQ